MKICHRLLPLILAAVLLGCSPVYNWREVRLPQGGIKLLLPCKHDSGSRKLILVGQSVDVHMAGCEAEATMFTLAHVEMADANKANAALSEWKAILLNNIQGSAGTEHASHYPVKASPVPISAVRVNAVGYGVDGGMVKAQAIWFVRGARLYQALALSEQLKVDAVETFFSGIELE